MPIVPMEFGGIGFLDDEDQADQLRRCLTDASLPLDVRIAGALIRLSSALQRRRSASRIGKV
jgi:hypothetical protein